MTQTSEADGNHSGGWVFVTQRRVRFEHRGEVGDYLDGRLIEILSQIIDRTGRGRLLLLPNHLPTVQRMVHGLVPAAIVLSGGNDIAEAPEAIDTSPERDQVEQWLLASLVAPTTVAAPSRAGRPPVVIGICRGAQVLARRAGARLGLDAEGHAGTEHPVQPATTSSTNVAAHHPQWLQPFPVISHHRHTLLGKDFPTGLVVLATVTATTTTASAAATATTVEAFTDRTGHLWGLMWHPEREKPAAHGSQLLTQILREALNSNQGGTDHSGSTMHEETR